MNDAAAPSSINAGDLRQLLTDLSTYLDQPLSTVLRAYKPSEEHRDAVYKLLEPHMERTLAEYMRWYVYQQGDLADDWGVASLDFDGVNPFEVLFPLAYALA